MSNKIKQKSYKDTLYESLFIIIDKKYLLFWLKIVNFLYNSGSRFVLYEDPDVSPKI